MRKKRNKEYDEPVAINMTSLIDVVFILLIFFMIGSTFEKPVMKVNLPEAETGKLSQIKSIEIIINNEGKIYIADKEQTIEELEIFLIELVKENPQVFVSISCDAVAEFQNFLKVMDLLSKVGVKNATVKHQYPKK